LNVIRTGIALNLSNSFAQPGWASNRKERSRADATSPPSRRSAGSLERVRRPLDCRDLKENNETKGGEKQRIAKKLRLKALSFPTRALNALKT
jgi:hypothetical protein